MKKISARKIDAIRSVIEDVKNFRFCGPGDDPDEITNVTLGYRSLLVQLQRLASPLLSEASSSRLVALNIEVSNLYDVFDVATELNPLILEIEDVLDESGSFALRSQNSSSFIYQIPIPVCSIVGHILGSTIYHHATLEGMFYEAGAKGEVPQGNCVTKCQSWLKRLHTEVDDPLAVLGKLLEEYMEVDNEFYTDQASNRTKIIEVFTRFGLSYRQGGIIHGNKRALPSKSLEQQLRDKDLPAISSEFDRCLENVDLDPPSAITAACSILEALFKVYIEDNKLEMPSKQTILPLWKVVSKDLNLEPSAVEDNDIKKILSGFTSVVDGIGSLRTHTGSAHGRGRRVYRVQSRHARLAVHASHTLVSFVIETWDVRRT